MTEVGIKTSKDILNPAPEGGSLHDYVCGRVRPACRGLDVYGFVVEEAWGKCACEPGKM